MTGEQVYAEARELGQYGSEEFAATPWPTWATLSSEERVRWEALALERTDKLIEDAAHDYRGIGDGS